MRYRRGHAQAPHPPPMPHQKITTCPLLKTTVALRENIAPLSAGRPQPGILDLLIFGLLGLHLE